MADQDLQRHRHGGARCVVEVRRMMKDTIAAELVLNPAIDMLLALYLEPRGDGALARSELCARTGADEEACRLWALALAQRGLISVEQDDYRLTPAGRRAMDELNDRIWSLGQAHLGAERPPA